MKSIKKYFDECVHELRLVQWSTRKTVVRYSYITIIFVLGSTLLILFLDSFLHSIVFLK